MAKLYRTSGTGNAQQTLDVNDEKIKIYADETSLDADLANIGENEIVATNEEDSQKAGTQYPVDIVQDGNMNAVTSNAVYDAIIASQTPEEITGVNAFGSYPITIMKSGHIVTLNCFVNSSTSVSADGIIASGIPIPYASTVKDFGFFSFNSQAQYDLYLQGTNVIRARSAIPSGVQGWFSVTYISRD